MEATARENTANFQTEVAFYATGEGCGPCIWLATVQAVYRPPNGCEVIPLLIDRSYAPWSASTVEQVSIYVSGLLAHTDAEVDGQYNALWQADLTLDGVTLSNNDATIHFSGAPGTNDACELWRMQMQMLRSAMRAPRLETVVLVLNGVIWLFEFVFVNLSNRQVVSGELVGIIHKIGGVQNCFYNLRERNSTDEGIQAELTHCLTSLRDYYPKATTEHP